ncbi:hypothetical protein F5888DRAFT_1697217 [Russula emetica]|nr:hypothetical protein F5888DRAFT_1697217 [Russula emetica]
METVGVDADSDSLSGGASLPRFLRPVQSSESSATQVSVPVHAVYSHKHPFGDAHVLWWPAQTRRVCDRSNKTVPTPRTILLFIPGNPGLLEFYVPFLNAIYRSVNSDSRTSSSPSGTTTSVTIFAHSHLGLSSYIQLGNSDKSWPEKSTVALRAQIQAHLEFLDELLVAYDDDNPTTRVLLIGHSIGCWLIQEILKARAGRALGPRVGAYMLFPTISHIVRSPNGRKLSLFFRPPWPRTLAYLALLVRHVIPLFILRHLLQPSWPTSQVRVVHNLLRAPASIYAALTMANDEMETVHELDTDFLRDFAQDLWFYYAEEDDWVGEQLAVVLSALRGTPTATESHVVLGRPGIPHAFCISASFFSSHRDHCSYLCFSPP